jgi:small-conductance mechanosensitive channel
MNGKKAKALRRAFRDQEKTVRFETHPFLYVNQFGQNMVRYTFQYINVGAKKLADVAKKIYDGSGVLPRG